MDPRLLTYAERPAPRYTSYPPAPHFSGAIGPSTTAAWLAEIAADATLSLYLHVPYCRQLCWYCGCNTFAARREEPVREFVDAVLHEVDLVSEALSGQSVVEIHWGGGTPNILSASQFAAIATRLANRFDLTALRHHAIELDPRHIVPDNVRAYVAAGVSRASLGVQDMNQTVQQAIGRVQPFETVRDAVTTLKAEGIDEISMDLMYGLPHQTVTAVEQTVQLAAEMKPNRIALFGYAHVPWVKKRQRLIPEASLPNASERFAQAEAARAALEARGYVAIGLDHFALPSDELAIAANTDQLTRSFQGYVLKSASALVGLGPSAISTLPQGYTQNDADPGAWRRAVASGALATVRGHALSRDDRLRRKLVEQIMCDFVGDLGPLGGVRACVDELDALSPMIADGMVRIVDDHIVLSAAARPFCRLVAMAFDTYAQRGAARHSSAV
ncbi:oxygen-independent coproporphyrinogen III oxidase [Terricaulis sp.]|uniref:oxygen-independent coproporphyrinogen III oxidase n=1 Tax=Terricaulis sp. TaxID=2768686 RepID=UPI002AC4A3C6|nr:oxygen-independent coproporphyrinogen III oxidase [Terricaulis sp.]MDZ4692272.1 oxygen-independent coproporphyrinogen III oxidase [Terricaulis sp.]